VCETPYNPMLRGRFSAAREHERRSRVGGEKRCGELACAGDLGVTHARTSGYIRVRPARACAYAGEQASRAR
jgi:hypothetical protein